MIFQAFPYSNLDPPLFLGSAHEITVTAHSILITFPRPPPSSLSNPPLRCTAIAPTFLTLRAQLSRIHPVGVIYSQFIIFPRPD